MRTAERVQERIQMFDKRLARLRAERDRLQARASQAERRRDTRRKIIIGGTVLAALNDAGVPAMKSQDDHAVNATSVAVWPSNGSRPVSIS